jgi:hypothetical protein
MASSRSLQENLALTDRAMETAQMVKPDTRELEAIKQFCSSEVKHRKSCEPLNEGLKTLRASQKQIREQLFKYIVDLAPEQRCLALSKEDQKRLDAKCTEMSLVSLPPFVRIVRAKKDLTINGDVLEEAIENITVEDLKETLLELKTKVVQEALRDVVLKNIRRIIQTYTESLKLVTALPKGLNAYNVAEASTEVADLMFELWRLECEIKAKSELKKMDDHTKSQMSDWKTRIETFFVRTGLTAQRIVIEGTPYRLVRRLAVVRPKLGITKMESIMSDILKRDTYQQLATFRPSDLLHDIQVYVSAIPPESKASIVLCAVRSSKEEPQE